MEALFYAGQSLTCVDIGAGRYPDRFKTWVLEHLFVGVVDFNARIRVLFASPGHFVWLDAADSDDKGAWNASHERVDVALTLSQSHS